MKKDGGLLALDSGIWAATGDLGLVPGVYFPVTSHIVRLESGGLLVHSPIDFSPEEVAAMRKLGEVEKIFAPNLGHTTYLKKAHELFPNAALLGPVGLREKVPGLPFSDLVGEDICPALAADFEQVFVGGAPSISEIILRHRKSSCLIVADYFFNIHEARGLFTRPLLRYVSDAWGKPTQSKLWRKAIKDKAAARKSAEAVLGLEFERVLVGHGRPIENGREVAETSLRWLFD